MEDSIFTKIIKGEIPSHKVYEDDSTLAFLDIYPKSTGQTVVVPKRQVPFVWELTDDEYQALMRTVHKVGRRLREVYPEKKRVGLTVEGLDVANHAHVVVFPFDTAKEFQGHADASQEPDHAKLAEIAERLRF